MIRDRSIETRAALAFLRHDCETALSVGLRLLGERWGADRAWFVRYNPSMSRLWMTHEWARIEIATFSADLQAFPVSMIRWLHARMLKGKVVMVPDIKAMPNASKALRTELLRQSNKSILFVPVFHRGRLVAQIGFDAVQHGRDWLSGATNPVKALETLGRLYMCAWERQRRAMRVPAPSRREGMIYFSLGRSKVGVEPEWIVSISSDRDYSTVILDSGRRYIELRSLRQWLTILPSDLFARVNHNLIVQTSRVQTLERKRLWRLQLTGEPTWHGVGRPYRLDLLTKLGI